MHEARYRETSLECYEVMKIAFGEDALKHFMMLSAFKYLWRYRQKGGNEDLNKARDYLTTIEMEELLDDEYEYMQARQMMEAVKKHKEMEYRRTAITSDNPYQE